MRGSGPQAAMLPDGERLHLNHGPIDLILWCDPPARAMAYACAAERFRTVLDELVAELPFLRSPAPVAVAGPVARRMAAAAEPFALSPALTRPSPAGGGSGRGQRPPAFITPMAAVAGAVADEIAAVMTAGTGARKVWVNNGGDIALYLMAGETMTALMAGGRVTLRAADPIRGIATSGWRGRSQSLGIADAVTVLAATGAMADAAATMLANAVDLPGHPAVTRRPATAVKADSDLGHRPVTVAVAPLPSGQRARALDRGLAAAEACRAAGLIHAAFLLLQGETRATASAPSLMPEPIHA